MTEKQIKYIYLVLSHLMALIFQIAALKLKEQQSKDRAADEEADRQSTSAANNTTTTTNNSRSSDDYVPATILQLFWLLFQGCRQLMYYIVHVAITQVAPSTNCGDICRDWDVPPSGPRRSVF